MSSDSDDESIEPISDEEPVSTKTSLQLEK